MKTLREFDFSNKRVLVRCDFNVPLDERGDVLDDFRIERTIPTIRYLIEQKARVILMSHLGRPEGKVVEGLRLDSVAKKLSELLGRNVTKLNDSIGQKVKETVENMQSGDIILLENIQFNPGEKSKDLNFAKTLASYADIFVLEAFGQAHRDYASISGIQKFLPSAAGFLLEQEIKNLTKLMENPEKPLVAIMGGAKVEEKTGLINKISEVADFILIGGLMSREIKEKNIELRYSEKIIGPIDEVEGKDIGLKTIEFFKEKILPAKTIFFNGVLGMVEKEEYSKGTEEILKAIAESSAFSVIGGGDMTKVVNKLGLIDKFSHVSTGGGAMLDFIVDGKLVGIDALK